MEKNVHVAGYEFDCLPAHIRLYGRGKGASLRVACQRAVADLLCCRELYRKHARSFKIAVIVGHVPAVPASNKIDLAF
jgi:hypothetical protein